MQNVFLQTLLSSSCHHLSCKHHIGAEINSVLKDSYRATIGGRPIFALFTRGSAYFKTLIACDRVFFGAQLTIFLYNTVRICGKVATGLPL